MVLTGLIRRDLLALRWCVLLIALLSAQIAPATEPAAHYTVTWTAGEGAESCAHQAEIRAAVARLVSPGLLTAPEQAERFIVGTVGRAGDGPWRAQISVQDAAGQILGERELESDASSCSELDSAAVLAITLIVDPERSQSPTQVVAPALPSSATAPMPVPVVRAEPARAENSAARVLEPRFIPQRSVGADAVVLSGVLPATAFGAQLELSLPFVGESSLRLAVAYFVPQTLEVSGSAGAHATFYAGTLRLGYCPLLAFAQKLSVFGCAGVSSGLMVASGHGGGYDRAPARGLLALDGALTVDRTLLGPWAVTLTGGVGLSPFRPKFSYQASAGEIFVYRRSPFEGRVEIGLAHRF